jgi:hypothetical protein
MQLQRHQANLAREQAKTTDQHARAASRKSKSEEDSLFHAIERILSATPNSFRTRPGVQPSNPGNTQAAAGIVPQNSAVTDESAATGYAN